MSNVTVLDTVVPIANCKAVTLYLDAMGAGTIDSVDVNNSSVDACGVASLSLDDTSFDCNDISGANVAIGNTVTMTVTDYHGNTSTCSANVTVLDTVAP